MPDTMTNRLSQILDSPLYVCVWVCLLIPRLHDTTGCQTGCPTGWTAGCVVYTNIQPVEQPVECLFTRCSRLSNRLFMRFDSQLYRVNGVLLSPTASVSGLLTLLVLWFSIVKSHVGLRIVHLVRKKGAVTFLPITLLNADWLSQLAVNMQQSNN